LIRALKRFFIKREEDKNPVQLREVSNEELLGRLQRGMPLEHITCDEYVPVPTDKRVSIIKREPDEQAEKIAKAKITRKKKVSYPQLKGTNNYRTGSYEAQINANNYISGIMPPKIKDKMSGLEMDDFDLNKIFAQRSIKVYDDEKWS